MSFDAPECAASPARSGEGILGATTDHTSTVGSKAALLDTAVARVALGIYAHTLGTETFALPRSSSRDSSEIVLRLLLLVVP